MKQALSVSETIRRTVLLFCILWAAVAVADQAERDVISVDTFTSEFINWATVHQDTFEFPEPALYEEITCQITIGCPRPPDDCDPWDRLANLWVRHVENDSTYTDYEMVRFITPYDITFAEGPQACAWTIDVTDYQFLLHDEVILRLYISSWIGGDDGWLVTATFNMVPGMPEREPFAIEKLWRVGNLQYGNPDNPIENNVQPVEVTVPEEATWAKFRAFSTGHGFWNTDNAAEFSYKWQALRVDTNTESHFLWRPDCASNPCSPQLGTWQYDRAGWCPGDKAEAWNVDVTDWVQAGGTHLFNFTFEPYENWCRPNNPDCTDYSGCECAGHAYYAFEGQVVFYRVPNNTAVDEHGSLPAKLHLVGNHPNPFNPETTIKYHLAEPGEVDVAVYTTDGAMVRTEHKVHAVSGTYNWTWHGRDQNGKSMPTGVYLYEVRYGTERVSAKMLLLK